MSNLSKSLDLAHEVARQPVQDRLDGKLGQAAEDAAARLMSAAGLSYVDASRLVSAIHWAGWNAGFTAGRTPTEKTEG